ncbi:DUF3987 domain-containing protein [Rubrivirga sp. IMCC45206]|uniref:DUF3987 domain-containing protein n=1 Tax=Rubrivirga sp. IMCC45206 TaxID=3391614 RepID=UPI00399023E7
MLDWRPFPTGALPESVARYIRSAALARNVDEAAVALPALAVLASAVGNAARLELKRGWEVPATLWAVVVAPSGSGKSPAWDAALAPVRDLAREAFAEHEVEAEAYADDLRRYEGLGKQAKANEAPPERPQARRFIVQDVTIEALADRHSVNPRGLLSAPPEAGAWLGGFNRYRSGNGGGDLFKWIEIHDGAPLTVDRKNPESPTLRINRPCVAVASTVQPTTLRRLITPEFSESGFLARLCLAEPPTLPRVWTDATIHPDTSAAYRLTVRRLYSLPETERAVPLSDGARQLLREFFNTNGQMYEAAPSDAVRAMLAKQPDRPARLALAFHLADCAEQGEFGPSAFDVLPPVPAATFARAVDVAAWLRREVFRIYIRHEFGGDGAAAFAERAVEVSDTDKCARLPSPFGWEDVAEAWGVKRTQAYEIIGNLTASGKAIQRSRGVYLPNVGTPPDEPDEPDEPAFFDLLAALSSTRAPDEQPDGDVPVLVRPPASGACPPPLPPGGDGTPDTPLPTWDEPPF